MYFQKYVKTYKKLENVVDSCGICLLEFENDEKLKSLNCTDFDTSKIEFVFNDAGKEIIKQS